MREMENSDSDERATVERESPDDLRVSALDGATPEGRHARPAWRWGLRLGGVVALLGLIAVAAVALSPLIPRPAARKAPPLDITALQIPAKARSCLVAGAWSPDSAQVAIVRDSVCNASSTQTGPTVMTFNGLTGALVNAYPLEAAILQTSAAPGATKQTPERVDLESVAWSPNGLQVAIPFIVVPLSATGPVTIGLALLTVRGSDTSVLEIRAETIPSFTPPNPLTQTSPQTVKVWDTQQGNDHALTVAPSFAYRWGADGSLAPVALADTPGSPAGPAGGAIISGGFSMWRSGEIWAVNALACSGGAEKFLPQPYIALDLSTLAWSPDGRYLAQVSAGGRYDAPGAPSNAPPEPLSTPTACSQGPEPDQIPLAPMRDAGLRSALALAASTGDASVDLEWRPDGQRLAALTFNVAGTGSAILIYDCRTGATLRRYTASQIPISGQPGTGPAKNFNQVFTGGAWSPDGRRLLIEATGTGAVPFIMGPGALGA